MNDHWILVRLLCLYMNDHWILVKCFKAVWLVMDYSTLLHSHSSLQHRLILSIDQILHINPIVMLYVFVELVVVIVWLRYMQWVGLETYCFLWPLFYTELIYRQSWICNTRKTHKNRSMAWVSKYNETACVVVLWYPHSLYISWCVVKY